MDVILLFGLIFATIITVCVALLVVQARENKKAGRYADPAYAARVRMRWFAGAFSVIIILGVVYLFLPYQGKTGWYYATQGGLLTYNNLFNVLIGELIVMQLVLIAMKHRGTQNPNSRYADPEYFKQVVKRYAYIRYIIYGSTIAIFLLLKYCF